MNKEDRQYKEKIKNGQEKLSDKAKDRAKKETIKKVIKIIGAKGIAVLMLVVLLSSILGIVFLAAAVDYNDWDTYTKGISAKAQAVGTDAYGKIITLEEDGKYKISYNGKTGKQAIEALLEENDMNFEDFTAEEIECLYKCLKAEWATTYPNLGQQVDNKDVNNEFIQGVITVKRANYTNPEGKNLIYKPYEEFKEIKDPTALDYFTMKDEKLIVANWSSSETIYEPSESMPDELKSQYINTGEQTSILETCIDYRGMIGIHTVPFEFLLALLVNTEDVEFVSELADLAFDSTIEITVHDNTKKITTIEKEKTIETTTYQKWVDYYTNVDYREIYQTLETEEETEEEVNEYRTTYRNFYENEEVSSSEENVLEYDLTITRITKNNSYVVGLTKVDSWFAKVANNYTYVETPSDIVDYGAGKLINYEPEVQEIEEINYDEEIEEHINNKPTIRENIIDAGRTRTITQYSYDIVKRKRQGTLNRTNQVIEHTTETIEYKYEKGTSQTSNVGEKFKEVYNNNPKAQAQLKSVSSWLFELLEETESSVDYVSIMKYLLYICTNENYGVTEEDIKDVIDIFQEIKSFQITSGSGISWWWPIGSSDIEVIDGVEYASGTPVDTYISSGVGPRWGKNHGGIDITGCKRGTNIIAAKAGIVEMVVDGYGDGYIGFAEGTASYGNFIKIKHDDGTVSIYAHLLKGTIKVSKNDTVQQGQVLAGMGTSGNSSGVHLHFEIRDISNNRLDPEEYVSEEEPRPAGSSSSLRDWIWGIEGGSSYINGTTWTVFDPSGEGDNTMNLAHGMVIADYNGAASWYPEIIPGNITVGQTVTEEQANKVWELKIKGFSDAIDSACVKHNVTLNANQRDALISCIYRLGYGKNQHNDLVSSYKTGGNAGLWGYMKDTYNKNSEYEKGTKNRVAEEYELFVKGDYTYQSTGDTKYNQYCNNPNI